MKTILKNVALNGNKTNILISNGLFEDCNLPDSALESIEAQALQSPDAQALAYPGAQTLASPGTQYGEYRIVDLEGTAILPSFYNTHNHAAMTLLRGYGDDTNLETWLHKYIWPYEAKLTAADIRKGSQWAVEEMLATGTTFFNDMYFEIEQTMDLVERAGMRMCVGITIMDLHTPQQHREKVELIKSWKDRAEGRITAAVAPHAIYTVSKEYLQEAAQLSREYGLKLHIHVAETKAEVADSLKNFGTTPVRYLERLGVLGENVIAAHCVHVDEEEWDILARRGVTVAHCPCSNMKLGSGRFPYELAIKSGARITLATDGASSNNNLDMREEMKFAALLAKVAGNPELLPAECVLKWATRNGAEAFGINGGTIENGAVADAILLNLSHRSFLAGHNLISDWVYAADSSAIAATLCNGRLIYPAGKKKMAAKS